MVTFAFDDPPKTAAVEGAAILEARGLRGTYFVAAGLAGQESPFGLYADEADVRRLAVAEHEIACHTYSHLDCGKASGAAIVADVQKNAQALEALGVSAETFAYPYGDVSPAAKAAIGERFSILRALHHGLIEDGADLNQAPAVGVEGPDGEPTALQWLREAARKHAWLILFTHDVAKVPSPFGCTPAALERLADAAQAMGFEVVTAAQGARKIGA